jgi:hypothetical protein
MQYTLITQAGRIMQFYFEATANCYQGCYGGVVFTSQILIEQSVAIVA